MQSIDKDIAAGIYVYAVEEFGKLLLLRNAVSLNGKRDVKYEKGFVDHKKKFKAAFDFFRNNNFHVWWILAQACFETSDIENVEDVDDVEWRDVVVDLQADTDSRLSIFYSDFVYDGNQNPVIESPPDVEPKMLQRATEQLEIATKGLPP